MACAAYDHESECWIYNGIQQTWTQTGQLNIDRYLGGIIEYKGSGFESQFDISIDPFYIGSSASKKIAF